jgi:DNA-binding MarR family transcriptional regulator
MMPAVQGSTEVDADLADRLGHLFGWYRTRCYDLIASRAGIRIDVSSQLVLAALNWLGPSRTSDVAVALGLDSSTVSRHIAKAIDKGWVSSSKDDRDGRAALVSLTRPGRALRNRLWREWIRMLDEATEAWSLREREMFLKLLTELNAALMTL